MSYILDALKKADAEREREGVPSLHAQHAQQGTPFDEHGAANSTPTSMLWAAAGLAAGALMLAAWWLLRSPTPGPVPMPSPPAVLATGRDAQGQPVGGLVQPAQPPQPVVPLAQSNAEAAPTPAHTAPKLGLAAGSANQANKPSSSDKGGGSSSRMGSAAMAEAGSPGHSGSTNKADSADRIVPVTDLPEDVRRDLPALSIGGAMHSDVPANRMIVLNGGIFHEGDQPAPGLLLEEIKLKSAIFRFKGHRYSVAF